MAMAAAVRCGLRGLMKRMVPQLEAVAVGVSSSSSSGPCSSAASLHTAVTGKGPLFLPIQPALSRRNIYRTYRGQAGATHVTKEKVHEMFCFQCEQTKDGVGCTTKGICGKDPQTAALQDVLVHSLKGLSQYAVRAKAEGVYDPELDSFVQEAIFATLTNVNFDAKAIQEFINETIARRTNLKAKYEAACKKAGKTPDALDNLYASFVPAAELDVVAQQGIQLGLDVRRAGLNEDIFSLQELLTYGIKGMAAYAAHAHAVGQADEKIGGFIYEAFDYISKPTSEQKMEELLALNLKCGEVNLTAMEILNKGHIHNFGTPEPTKLRTTPVKGKCIVVSGHDLKDLYELLKATEGTGINIYTHGEMLPAFGYPELKKFTHLVGNYGGAWQKQKVEFALFPGPILVTTNCILEPKPSYQNRIYCVNAVGHPKVTHLKNRNFQPLIDQALAMDGFPADAIPEYTMTGFGHDAVIGVADKVLDLVQTGKLRRIFLVGGCDGFEGDRSYYKELATRLPKDTLVMTLACGKYRFNKLFDSFGSLEGSDLPRLMDIGQCNDAYSAIRIASALAEALKTDINSLPLSMVLSWFEQKAVAVLLTLLHLGVENIRIGPKLPAFISPNVLSVLVDKYKLTPISGPEHVDDDIRAMMNLSVVKTTAASATTAAL